MSSKKKSIVKKFLKSVSASGKKSKKLEHTQDTAVSGISTQPTSLFTSSNLTDTLFAYPRFEVFNSTPPDNQKTILHGSDSFGNQKRREKSEDEIGALYKEQLVMEQKNREQSVVVQITPKQVPNSFNDEAKDQKGGRRSKSEDLNATELDLKQITLQQIVLETPAKPKKLSTSFKNSVSFNQSANAASHSVLSASKADVDLLSAQDLVSKDRHRKSTKSLPTQKTAQTLPTKSPESRPAKNYELALNELATKVFQLHTLLGEVSKAVDEFSGDTKPGNGLTETRNAFVRQWKNLEKEQKKDAEHVLPEANKLLEDCDDMLFGVRRRIGQLYKKETYP